MNAPPASPVDALMAHDPTCTWHHQGDGTPSVRRACTCHIERDQRIREALQRALTLKDDLGFAVAEAGREADEAMTLLERWDAWWFSTPDEPQPHPTVALANETHAWLHDATSRETQLGNPVGLSEGKKE
jgi:hypothetical protein